MGYRLSKITTRTGDDGKTQLGDGQRIYKDDACIEALGTLDELNSSIGMLLAHLPSNHMMKSSLQHIQQNLFHIGGELCPPHHPALTTEEVVLLEQLIEQWNAALPPLKEFILPDGNIQSTTCHLVRTICRRAERTLVKLHQEKLLRKEILCYLNRLSDLFFVMARVLARETASEEILWDHERKK